MRDTFHYKKQLGQHFLQSEHYQKMIVSALKYDSSSAILEIGPGKGALTNYLIPLNKKLYLVEIDYQLINYWKEKLSDNLCLLETDILKLDLSKLQEKSLAIIGNIPYNITTPILFHLITYKNKIDYAVLMMQKELAERVVSKEGSRDYGILSIMCQLHADIDTVCHVPASAFFPKPKVDSVVLQFRFKSAILNDQELSEFRKLIQTAFSQRRKMLRNNLKSIVQSISQELIPIDLSRRPESLSIKEWIGFFQFLKENNETFLDITRTV